jgi:hypothetical protein
LEKRNCVRFVRVSERAEIYVRFSFRSAVCDIMNLSTISSVETFKEVCAMLDADPQYRSVYSALFRERTCRVGPSPGPATADSARQFNASDPFTVTLIGDPSWSATPVGQIVFEGVGDAWPGKTNADIQRAADLWINCTPARMQQKREAEADRRRRDLDGEEDVSE